MLNAEFAGRTRLPGPAGPAAWSERAVGVVSCRWSVRVTACDVERVPPGNLRVPRDQFATVWTEAERVSGEISAGRRPGDDYVIGVLATCRWLATAIVPTFLGGVEPARAPVTLRSAAAHEEIIDYELRAAERLAARDPGGIAGQPGRLEAILTTLRWAWLGAGEPPLDVRHPATG